MRQSYIRHLVAVAALVGTVACTGGPGAAKPESGPTFDPTQILLVMGAAAESPMALVLNDQPAGDDFLHTPSTDVRWDDPVLFHLVQRMRATVAEEKGVGIAAPQVGLDRRVILVKRVDIEPKQPFEAYLNARLTWLSDETETGWEGCLSIPAGFGQVRRSLSVEVEYDTMDGTHAQETVEGYAARIFQHEIDHLDGVLFIDRMEEVDLMPKDEYRAMKAAEADGGS